MGYKRPGPNFILSGPLLLLMRRKRQNVGRANTLAGRKGIMAFDIARVRSGIGIRLRRPSLFCNELSSRYNFTKIVVGTVHLKLSPIGSGGARFSARLRSDANVRGSTETQVGLDLALGLCGGSP